MIHEWWGLNSDIVNLADVLSREGYVVLAADGFRGKVARTPQDAMKQVQETPAAQIAMDIDAAYGFLKSNPKVDPARIASLGFCFGGTQSMYLGTRNPGLAAVVIFYGPGPITDAEKLGRMKDAGALLGIFGADDTNIPVKDVQAFEGVLKAAGVKSTITVYPGVGHAFVKSATYKSGTAQKAWKQMTEFLKTVFKS
jgi:carboxymethylenebutenolidase